LPVNLTHYGYAAKRQSAMEHVRQAFIRHADY